MDVRRPPQKICQSAWIFLAGLLVAGAANLLAVELPKISTNEFAAYAGSASCLDCHRAEFNLWQTSHHALAERAVQPALDRPAFVPARDLKHGDESVSVLTNFQIVTRGLESHRQPWHVERVLGHEPLRQFMTPFPGGRFQVHEASYAPQSNQWFYVYGDDLRSPGEYGHWTGRGMNWNSQCAACHNTALKPNYAAASDSYHTTLAEMAVGCEACHGALKAHNGWQQAHPQSPDPTVAKLNPARLVGMCGSCHSRNTDLTGNFKPGDAFFDHYALDTLDYSRHWYPDGQIKDEDYELTSFLGSQMSHAGVTCLDCHNPHSAKNTLVGNELCMRCHKGGYPKAPVINLAEHTHHKLNGHGSDCIGCHMPTTVYMQRQPRHDHGFTIPDPLLTKELNLPNACNRCHTDKGTDWALKQTDAWYGDKMNRSARDRARWIAAAADGDARAQDKLLALLTDTNQPTYWHAVTTAFLAQWANESRVTAVLLGQLKHESPLVREKAVRALEPILENTNILSAVQSLLADPVRSVRVAAAGVLWATVDMRSQAGQELQTKFDLAADQPSGQFEQAMFLLARQQPAAALVHLKHATAWDPISPPFLCQQAQVQDQLGQLPEALQTLDRAAAAMPDDAHIPFVRALILKRNGRTEAAKSALNKALKIQPDFQPAVEMLRRLP